MTSDDTNALTIQLLESNSYFGMEPSQVKILKQEKVACLADNDARLALDPNDKYRIQFCDLTDKATWAWRCSFSSLFKWLA
jgi:UDP-sugar pyrophosphorylase